MEISTKRYAPWRLVSYEAYQSEDDARARESALKNHGNAVREFKKRAKKSFKNSAGFTLIETLVATFVLVTAIVGPLSIVAKGVFFANFAKDQITAFYLAQEAIEYVRNKRDNTTIAGRTWADFKANAGTSNPPGIHDCLVAYNAAGCIIDTKYDTIVACSSSCANIKQDSSGLYNYLDGAESQFRRTVKIHYEPSGDPNSNEVRVEVRMDWQNGVLAKNFILRESLLNWQ